MDLLIGADAEGGDVTPMYPGSASPHPAHLALGAVDDVGLTRAVGLEIGNDLARAGINLNLAPVADVGTNPVSPVTGTRAFGADPALVVRHAAAYADGLKAAGIAAAAKHFPGLGNASNASDISFPVSPGDLDAHLAPFRVLIDAGVPALLTSHAIYPALDGRPATFSPAILTDLLRDRLGFEGVVISDSVTTAMVIAQLGSAEAAVRAFAAGADMVCMMGGMVEQRAARDHVIAAVAEGRLPEHRMVESARRVGELARAHAKPDGSPSRQLEWSPDVARRLLYIDAHVPLARPPYVIEFSGARHGSEPAGTSLLSRLQQLDPEVTGVRLAANAAGLAYAVRAAPADRPLLLVAQNAHLEPRLSANLATVLELRSDAVLVGLGTTADGRLAPGRYVGTRGSARPSIEAAARCLLPPG
jgi:beta-N-acetylhexosaminidase